MSLPNDLREQLLTGYLDDALTVDERTRVDQLLASDSDFAAELKELREIRAALKCIAKVDEDVRLGSGFAEQVLDAAVARAQSEGLSDDHPLLRLAEQPSLSRRRSSIDWRLPVTVVALAASILFAIFILNLGDGSDPIADQNDANEAVIDPATESADPSLLVENTQTPGESDSDSIARQDPESVASPDAMDVPESVDPTGVDVPTPDRIVERQPEPPIDVTGENPSEAMNDAIVATESPAKSTDRPALDEQMLLGGSPLLVYSVKLTELGKQNDAFNNALSSAQIGAARKQEVDSEAVGFVAGSPDDLKDASKAKVIYLQAPLKSLDRLYFNLLEDVDGFSKVGIGISVNSPVGKVVDTVRVEPTDVKHTGRVLELISGGSQIVEHMVVELEQLPFNFDRESKMKMSQNDGPDEMGQVLVLILP